MVFSNHGEQRMNRLVYVPHYNSKFNYDSANEFGELVLRTNEDFTTRTEQQVRLSEKLNVFLSDFDPEWDFLLISGSPAVSMYCAAALARSDRYPFRGLRFNRIKKIYEEITFYETS